MNITDGEVAIAIAAGRQMRAVLSTSSRAKTIRSSAFSVSSLLLALRSQL